jgi:hypothetical protein
MDALTDLTITVKVDTAQARQEVEEFRSYAMRVIDEIRAAYAAMGPVTSTGWGQDSGFGGFGGI